jgi:TIR domain/Domain of unknown function (DUF4062)
MSPTSAEQSFTRAYAVDVFISYGHIDNQANWVTHFHSVLETRLQELLGSDRVSVWRDGKLNGVDAFEDVIRQRVGSSALFISVLSPRYVASPSCRNELDWFVEAAKHGTGLQVETQSRLIRVVKTKLLQGTQPPNFSATLGYEFYEPDPQNPELFREFGSQEGMPRFDKFADGLDTLAQTVAHTLRRMRQDQPSSKENVKTIFLARTTSDLEPRRASIQSELLGRGHQVVPAEPLPDTGSQLKVAVEALLSKADISVHLIGRRYGVIPEEEKRSFGELLYDLAFAQRERKGFHQLVWIPEDLQDPEDSQQAFLAKLRGALDQMASGKGDVFETSFESFKEGLLDVVSRKPEPPTISTSVKARAVYLLCDQPDLRQEQLEKIKAYLRSRGHPVDTPPFEGDPEELRAMEEELIGDTDAALIYYGTAKDLWVLRKRKNVLKVLSTKQKGRDYARALYLATPKNELKEGTYLTIPDHTYLEIEGFPPLLLLGDCEEFQPEKLDAFIKLIEKEP